MYRFRRWIGDHFWLMLASPADTSSRTLILFFRTPMFRPHDPGLTLGKWKNGEKKWLENRLNKWLFVYPMY